MVILFYSQGFYQKSVERKSPKEYFLCFVLMSGLGLEPWLYSDFNRAYKTLLTECILGQEKKMTIKLGENVTHGVSFSAKKMSPSYNVQ